MKVKLNPDVQADYNVILHCCRGIENPSGEYDIPEGKIKLLIDLLRGERAKVLELSQTITRLKKQLNITEDHGVGGINTKHFTWGT